MHQNEHSRRYEGSRRGRNRSSRRNRSDYYYGPEREHGPNYYSENDQDSDRSDYDRQTYAHGHNYRSNSSDRDDYGYDRSGRNNRDDDSYYAEQNHPQPDHRSDWGRSDRGSRAVGDQGSARYPDRSRAYGNESNRGYGAGFYGGRQGWDSAYQRDDYDWDDDRGFLDKAGDEVRSWFGDDEAQRRRIRDGHIGRGPSGYTRSDNRIIEDVNDRLTEDYFVDASNINVSVTDCEVTLDGTVHNRGAKRKAEDCADSVSGVKHVQNNLRVEERSNQNDYSSAYPPVTETDTAKSSKTH